MFEQFHLTDYHNELIENLSHGTRQRVAIAPGLLHDPKVLIIDEPMVGLDPMHARVVKDEFKARSRAGCTIFLSTHTLSVAEEMADRIGIINHGRLIALGTVTELRRAERRGGRRAGENLPFARRCRGQAPGGSRGAMPPARRQGMSDAASPSSIPGSGALGDRCAPFRRRSATLFSPATSAGRSTRSIFSSS